MRKYKSKTGASQYGKYDKTIICQAVAAVKKKVLTLGHAAKMYKIPKSTLSRKVRGLQLQPPGHPLALSNEEEQAISHTILIAADWGFPLRPAELCDFVCDYLQAKNKGNIFKHGRPTVDWATSFINRQEGIKKKLSHNIKASRAKVNVSKK